jgi:hypothetical protein
MGRHGVLMPGKTPSRKGDVQRQSGRSASAGHPLLNLQRSVGNQAIQRLIRSPYIQAKLNVSSPGDQFEQEADRVAYTVMRMPDDQVNPGATVSTRTQISRLQRQCTECEEKIQRQELEEEEEPVQAKLDGQRPKIQRLQAESSDKVLRRPAAAEEENEEEELVQGKAAEGGGHQVSQGVQSQIDSFRGGGQPLPTTLRAYFEPRFGHDFGAVRIHAGAQAAETARSINAQAFTVGRDVAFAVGQYSPETGAGKRLLAHELTHVIQQNGGTPGWLDGARQGLTIQRQTGTSYGLASAGSQNKYVAEAVRLWTTKKTMKVEDFVNDLMNAIKKDLLSQGVPELNWQMIPGSGISGSFDSEHWIVNIDPGAFSVREVTITEVKDLTLDEVREVVGTLYHESRHTDQDVLIIRVLLDQKKAVKDIVQETKIPERIVNAVKATKFKTPPDTAQVAHATRMFAVMYGEHKELLDFLMKNSQVVGGVQELVSASDADALKDAAPHVEKLAEWKKNVLEPKVKKLEAGKKGGPVEAQLKRDLGALNQVTAHLLAAFATAVKRKNPTEAGLKDLRFRTVEWQKKLIAAYRNLEGEKDALAIEESVKKAFKKGATAKPTPAPTKKK